MKTSFLFFSAAFLMFFGASADNSSAAVDCATTCLPVSATITEQARANCLQTCEQTFNSGGATTVNNDTPWKNDPNQSSGQLPIQDPTLGGQGAGSYTGGTGTSSTACDPGFESVAGVCFPITDLPDPQGGIAEIIYNFMYWLMAIFGMLSIIAFVISGIQYVTSAGDDSQIETAKTNMKWSIVGVLVGLSGLIIITAISRALSGNPFI